MVPIRDVQGRVVGFTARQLPQTPDDDPAREAKYVNSPETPIFHKGRILFGMDHARSHLKEGDGFLLVEGQLDAIRCWSVGLHGSGPTRHRLTESRCTCSAATNRVVECLMDGDAAGRKAALRYIPLAFKGGLEFRFLILPEKADPDDLLREYGPAALEPYRQQARSAIELAIEASLPPDRAPSTHEKTTTLRKVFELLRYVPSEVAREDYIHTPPAESASTARPRCATAPRGPRRAPRRARHKPRPHNQRHTIDTGDMGATLAPFTFPEYGTKYRNP